MQIHALGSLALCKVLNYAVWYYTKSGIMQSLVLCRVWSYAKSCIMLSHNMQSPLKRVFSESKQLMAIYLVLIKEMDPFVCNGPRL